MKTAAQAAVFFRVYLRKPADRVALATYPAYFIVQRKDDRRRSAIVDSPFISAIKERNDVRICC
jgi:hypothetical protein